MSTPEVARNIARLDGRIDRADDALRKHDTAIAEHSGRLMIVEQAIREIRVDIKAIRAETGLVGRLRDLALIVAIVYYALQAAHLIAR